MVCSMSESRDNGAWWSLIEVAKTSPKDLMSTHVVLVELVTTLTELCFVKMNVIGKIKGFWAQ